MAQHIYLTGETRSSDFDATAGAYDTALDGVAAIDDIVHYRIGPSVGAHTGPGTFGLFVFPTIR